MHAGQPELLSQDDDGLDRAAALLSEGALVALPTETVYGLAADARNARATARIFEAKGRPRFNPLIVHLRSLAEVEAIAYLPGTARALAQAFWPGPLTLVLPLRDGHGLSPLVSAGLPTVAIRLPAHPTMRAVLDRLDGPVAAPSANRSGEITATTAAHVAQAFGTDIAAVLDGGPARIGLESTILAPSDNGTRLLREGGLPREEIEPLTGPLILDTTPGRVSAPGQLSRHYAPDTPLDLGTADMATAPDDTLMIGFGDTPGHLTLSPSGDLLEAAAALFATLHEADSLARAEGFARIRVAPIPERGLGRAINDRLRRAAAPRADPE